MGWCKIVLNEKVQHFILVVIVINAITLGLETVKSVEANFGGLLTLIDHVILGIFVVELLLKIMALKLNFVKDPWNIFDFLIVAISFVPSADGLSILRALRVLRVLRLISGFPKLRLIVRSLLVSLPSIGWISLLMVIVFYVFGVMATKLFGQAFPDWFGTLGSTLYTLFQIMTLESWSMGIARPVMEVFPYAHLFFVPFVLISSFVVLNIFVAILVNDMSSSAQTPDDHPDQDKDSPKEPQALDETQSLRNEIKDLRASLQRMEALLTNYQEKQLK